MDGVEHQFYTMTSFGEPEPSIWGLSFLVSSIKKGLVGTWEVGTPRRVVVASKKICWWYSKKDFVVEPRRVGGGSVLHAISPISEAKTGWWVV